MFRFHLAIILASFGLTPIVSSQEPSADNTSAKSPASSAAPHLEQLPLLPELHAVHQFSSRNKKGENGDSKWCLYQDEYGDSVIFDVEGPGCVRSMWSTDIREDALFKFYFDGEKEPRYQIPMLAFYRGQHPHFPGPLVSLERRGRWGERPFAGNSFVPVPFAKGLKIAVSGDLRFFHILFTRYAHGTAVHTFTGKEDHNVLLQAFANRGDAPVPLGGVTRHTQEIKELVPGQWVSLFDLSQSGRIQEFVIEGEASDRFMQDVTVRMTWDDLYPSNYLACYWPNPNFNSPFANCVGDVQEEGGGEFNDSYTVPSCYSRFHLEAPIPFFNSLDARIQHGGLSTIHSQYGSLGFVYLRTRPSLVLTDFIDVGNPGSEELHGYEAKESQLYGPIDSHPEGSLFRSDVREKGRIHGSGAISFVAAVDPNNRGVRLRRRLDQGIARQTAKVFIDDEFVGIWYDPNQNEFLRWCDSDFDIHPKFTRNKDRLQLKLEICTEDGRGQFTDFRYEVFSYVD